MRRCVSFCLPHRENVWESNWKMLLCSLSVLNALWYCSRTQRIYLSFHHSFFFLFFFSVFCFIFSFSSFSIAFNFCLCHDINLKKRTQKEKKNREKRAHNMFYFLTLLMHYMFISEPIAYSEYIMDVWYILSFVTIYRIRYFQESRHTIHTHLNKIYHELSRK